MIRTSTRLSPRRAFRFPRAAARVAAEFARPLSRRLALARSKRDFASRTPRYREYYGSAPMRPELTAERLRLPEIYRSQIRDAPARRLPRCYATSMMSRFNPLLKKPSSTASFSSPASGRERAAAR